MCNSVMPLSHECARIKLIIIPSLAGRFYYVILLLKFRSNRTLKMSWFKEIISNKNKTLAIRSEGFLTALAKSFVNAWEN